MIVASSLADSRRVRAPSDALARTVSLVSQALPVASESEPCHRI